MSALLLKKKYIENKDNLMKMTPQQLEGVASGVFAMMGPNKQLSFMKRCCDIIVKIYTYMVPSGLLRKIVRT